MMVAVSKTLTLKEKADRDKHRIEKAMTALNGGTTVVAEVGQGKES